MGRPLILQTDFGTCDGAVCAMYGVAFSVDENLKIYDLTHGIPQYNIWEASYRLMQSMMYWPAGSIFVSVVDPGVGTERRSIAACTNTGHFVITPDNGTLSHIMKKIGIREMKVINEDENSLPGSKIGHTFCGRDLYVYAGAKLASGIISFEELGHNEPLDSIYTFDIGKEEYDGECVKGIIDVHDVRFGSLWTNITGETFVNLDVKYGEHVEVIIKNGDSAVYRNAIVFSRCFGDVCEGEELIYINSIGNAGIAINKGSFAEKFNIGSGPEWHVVLRKAD